MTSSGSNGAIRLLDVVVPLGGWAMAFAECYLDETETTGHRPVFSVAGVIFKKESAIEQAEAWKLMLGRWGLPFFHMTDCANGNGVFKEFSNHDRDKIAREAIGIIRDTVSAYVYVTIEISAFEKELEIIRYLGGPYEWCAISIFPSVAGWCEKNSDVSEVHYFFEDGAYGKANASYRISEMLSDPTHRSECKYAGLSFVEKQKSPGVQAADVVAWHSGKDAKRAFAGEPRRKDFEALIAGIPAFGGNWSSSMLKEIACDASLIANELSLPIEKLSEIDHLARRTPKRARSG